MSAVPEETPTWTEEQATALTHLGEVLAGFASAFQACADAGIRPAEALRACGIQVPMIAAPMLDRLLETERARSLVADAETEPVDDE